MKTETPQTEEVPAVVQPPLVRQSWRKRNKEMPERGQRVVAFSPVYPEGHEMRFRILDGQFLRITTEVEYWTDCEELFQYLPNAKSATTGSERNENK